MTQPKLIFKIENKEAIPLEVLSSSFSGIANEYKRINKDGSTIIVERIDHGSIILTLVSAAHAGLPFIEHTRAILDFSEHLLKTIKFLLGKSEECDVDKKGLENMRQIIEPAANATGNAIVLNINGDNNVITLNTNEARAAQNMIDRLTANDKSAGVQTNMVMRWQQANSSPKGNKGIVESISGEPIRVVFASDDIHQSMIELDKNPFHHAYLVDIDVQTVNGKPALYKITKLHDIIEV